MRKIFFTIILTVNIFGQARIGDWDSFTSTLHVQKIVQYENYLIGATDGGILIYDLNNQIFSELDNINGLAGTNLSCLAIDNSGYLWIGGGEPRGFVQIYDVFEQKSIAEFNYDMTEIMDFAISDAVVYSIYKDNNDYGLQEFIYQNSEFIHKDLYPNWPQGKKINQIEIYGEQVFVATEIGLFVGQIGSDPYRWDLLSADLDKNIIGLQVSDDILYFLMEEQLFQITIDDLSYIKIDQSSNSNPLQFIVSDDRIIYLNENKIEIVTAQDRLNIPIAKNSINSISKYNEDEIVIASTTGLAFLNADNSLAYKLPNTPHQNNLQAITILNDGRIVAGNGNGLSIKESNGWRSILESNDEVKIQQERNFNYFIADSLPVDFGVSISRMVQGPDDRLYCAIEGTHQSRNGGGILIIDVDNPSGYTIIDTTYLDYFADDYMIIKDIDFDRNGNLWIADAFATNKREPLHVRSMNNEWRSHKAENTNGAIGLTPHTLALDAWQRIWIGSFQDSDRNIGFPNGGLTMYSYNGDPIDPDEENWYRINLDNTNINTTIWSLAMSQENRLYILTPTGLTFVDLQFANDDPIKNESPRYYFPNISFGQESEVRLDARENAWVISESDGIHVLLSNSTFWPDANKNIEVESINTDNYPLLSDNVSDIAFDDENGVAYLSTLRGINSFRIPFADSKKNYSQIRVFPSPFHIPAEKPLVIDNLKDESSLKVMTIAGRVLRSIETVELGNHGYQIEWDGRNESGKLVSSGVYLLSVYTKDGSGSFTKIAVIRH